MTSSLSGGQAARSGTWFFSTRLGFWHQTCTRGVPKMVGFPPKSSILIGFSIINHPFWGYHYFWKHPQGVLQHGFCFKWLWSIFCLTRPTSPKRWHFGREIPLFQGNLAWWNIIIWPEWSKFVWSLDAPIHLGETRLDDSNHAWNSPFAWPKCWNCGIWGSIFNNSIRACE